MQFSPSFLRCAAPTVCLAFRGCLPFVGLSRLTQFWLFLRLAGTVGLSLGTPTVSQFLFPSIGLILVNEDVDGTPVKYLAVRNPSEAFEASFVCRDDPWYVFQHSPRDEIPAGPNAFFASAGRHRGLPVAIDRSVLLPGDLDKHGDDTTTTLRDPELIPEPPGKLGPENNAGEAAGGLAAVEPQTDAERLASGADPQDGFELDAMESGPPTDSSASK